MALTSRGSLAQRLGLHSGSMEPSHVLTAMGVPEDLARGSIRLTVGTDNTMAQMDYVLDTLPRSSPPPLAVPTWPERSRAKARIPRHDAEDLAAHAAPSPPEAEEHSTRSSA
jgi:hypothetical protein